MEDLPERLTSRLRKFVGNANISGQTRIYHDLGIGGDDAWELLDDVREEFGVDFSNFNFSKYFPDESEALPEKIARAFKLGPKRPPLTVDHLLKAIEVGRWEEPTTTAGPKE